MLPAKIAFLDLETTGANLARDKIIEIGIIRVENGRVTKKFQSLVNPGCFVPPGIEILTGIRAADLEDAPDFYQIKDQVSEILGGCVFLAHNARFDLGFLKKEFRRFGQPFAPKQICTVKLSRILFPAEPHHNLDALIGRHKLKCKVRHRALEDAGVLWQFYKKMRGRFGEEGLEQALNQVMKTPAIPIHIPRALLDGLAEKPGVYIFYGESGAPLYVGKSVNIRSRVLSHFSSDHLSPKEMKISQQVRDIETITTCGELGALLLESQTIKKLQPLYNRRLRQSRGLVYLKQTTTQNGYFSVSLKRGNSIGHDDLEDILGVFGSAKKAKERLLNMAKEFKLCEKLLGLQSASSACFGYTLGRCKGGCIGKEQPSSYNLRFILAFARDKIPSWPFEGPVFIKEEDVTGERVQFFWMDKWCFLGTTKDREYLERADKYDFDLDTYKILRSYLKSKRGMVKINTLKAKGKNSPVLGKDYEREAFFD